MLKGHREHHGGATVASKEHDPLAMLHVSTQAQVGAANV